MPWQPPAARVQRKKGSAKRACGDAERTVVAIAALAAPTNTLRGSACGTAPGAQQKEDQRPRRIGTFTGPNLDRRHASPGRIELDGDQVPGPPHKVETDATNAAEASCGHVRHMV